MNNLKIGYELSHGLIPLDKFISDRRTLKYHNFDSCQANNESGPRNNNYKVYHNDNWRIRGEPYQAIRIFEWKDMTDPQD